MSGVVRYDWRSATLTIEPLEDGGWSWRVKTSPVMEDGGIRATPFLASGVTRTRRGSIRAANRVVRKRMKYERKFAKDELSLDVANGLFW